MLNVTNDNKEEIKGLKLFGLLFPVRGGRLNKFLLGAPADLEPALRVINIELYADLKIKINTLMTSI